MSSSPSVQPQGQTTSASQNPEHTDKRNPHRNRGSRSINPGDSIGGHETGLDKGQRQNRDYRRRHKPRGSNADGPRASLSAPVSPELDRAPTDPSPASFRTPSNNPNRLPHSARDRALPSHNQNVNPQTSGQSGQKRRAVRSNPASGEPRGGAAAPSSDARKRGKAPAGDDLTSVLIFSLSTPPFPECMICFNPIRPEQPTWSCSPREEKEAQSCWNTFHLKCIQPWAEKNVKDIEEAWRARGEERKGEWRCPGCQSKREIVPRKYW
jgi:transcriptional repressor NF-X1